MPKCDFNKVDEQLHCNHTSAWVFSSKFAAYFRNTFSCQHLWMATSIQRIYFLFKGAIYNNLSNSIENSQCYEALETKTVDVLDKHALRKTKLLKGNHKPHVSIKLKKEITKRSELKGIANKTGKGIDLHNFRKQRNLVVNLNKKRSHFGRSVNLTFRIKE